MRKLLSAAAVAGAVAVAFAVLPGRASDHLDAPLDELIARAERRTATGEWTAAPMTVAHFEEWATVFEPPGEAEMCLFDEPEHDR